MTYDQLKRLAPKELLELLSGSVGCALHPDEPPLVIQADCCNLTPPVLMMIGDFEIRARFHEAPQLAESEEA